MNTEYEAYIRVINAPKDSKNEWKIHCLYFELPSHLHLESEPNTTWQLQVYKIKWQGPHTPVGRWHKVKTLLSPLDQKQVEKETTRLLKNKRHFGFCIRCEKHIIEGYMHSEDHCDTCAENHLGICY